MFERKTSKLQKPSEVQKGIPHLHPKTIPDFHENLGLPENSQRLATPRSQPLGLVQSNLRENEEMSFE